MILTLTLSALYHCFISQQKQQQIFRGVINGIVTLPMNDINSKHRRKLLFAGIVVPPAVAEMSLLDGPKAVKNVIEISDLFLRWCQSYFNMGSAVEFEKAGIFRFERKWNTTL